MIATISIAVVLGIPMGVVAAWRRDAWPDTLVRLVAILSAVTPTFFLALLLQILAGYILHILPTTGRLTHGTDFAADITGLFVVDSLLKGQWTVLGDALRHLLLPAVALSAATMGQMARITRASMLEVANQDYIEASRAFGIPDWLRVIKYMLRPSLMAPMTILGLEFASMMGNAFVVELIFSWPGMAAYGIRTILQKDLNAVMGVVMVSGVFFVVVNLLVDILAGFVDPRIRIRGRRT